MARRKSDKELKLRDNVARMRILERLRREHRGDVRSLAQALRNDAFITKIMREAAESGRPAMFTSDPAQGLIIEMFNNPDADDLPIRADEKGRLPIVYPRGKAPVLPPEVERAVRVMRRRRPKMR